MNSRARSTCPEDADWSESELAERRGFAVQFKHDHPDQIPEPWALTPLERAAREIFQREHSYSFSPVDKREAWVRAQLGTPNTKPDDLVARRRRALRTLSWPWLSIRLARAFFGSLKYRAIALIHQWNQERP